MTAAAGSKTLISDYDTLQTQITNLEGTGTAAVQSSVTGSGTTTSTSYTSTLTGSTFPSVTVTLAAGQNCLVMVTVELLTSGTGARASFTVSGTATEASTDIRSVHNNNTVGVRATAVTVYTAGSAGSYTFQMQGKTATGSGTFANKTMAAVPLPYNS